MGMVYIRVQKFFNDFKDKNSTNDKTDKETTPSVEKQTVSPEEKTILLKESIGTAQILLKGKISEYNSICNKIGVKPDVKVLEWENSANIEIKNIVHTVGQSYNDALSNILKSIQQNINEISDAIRKLTIDAYANTTLLSTKSSDETVLNNKENYSQEQIAELKNNILKAQSELKDKINEYKNFCSKNGIQLNIDLMEYEKSANLGADDIALEKGETTYDALNKRFKFVENAISKVTQAINELTKLQELREKQKLFSSEYDAIKSLIEDEKSNFKIYGVDPTDTQILGSDSTNEADRTSTSEFKGEIGSNRIDQNNKTVGSKHRRGIFFG